MDDRTCPVCGSDVTGHPSRRYCSDGCSKKADSDRHKARYAARTQTVKMGRSCELCGSSIPVDAHGGASYCSDACQKKARRRERVSNAAAMRERRRLAGTALVTVRPTRCRKCDAEFVLDRSFYRGHPRLYCGPECLYKYRYEPVGPFAKTCRVCGDDYESTQQKSKFCSKRCEGKSPKRKARSAARRGATAGPSDFSSAEIAERDGWVCGLCGSGIPKRHRWPQPLSLSIDHIVPVSFGGEHSARNVQASHLRCNQSKGARSRHSQLRLIG